MGYSPHGELRKHETISAMTYFLPQDVIQATGVALIQYDPGFFPRFWALVQPTFLSLPEGGKNQPRAAKVEVRADTQAMNDVVAALSR